MSDRQCLHVRNIGEIMSFHILIIFWGHSMKKPKKPRENQKKQKKQYFQTLLGSLHEKTKKPLRKPKKKKQYFQTLLGSLHEKTKKTLRKPKKTKKTIFSDSLGGGALEIVSKYCFFCCFLFFWFSQGFFGFSME